MPRLDGAGGLRERDAVPAKREPHRCIQVVENEIAWQRRPQRLPRRPYGSGDSHGRVDWGLAPPKPALQGPVPTDQRGRRAVRTRKLQGTRYGTDAGLPQGGDEVLDSIGLKTLTRISEQKDFSPRRTHPGVQRGRLATGLVAENDRASPLR